MFRKYFVLVFCMVFLVFSGVVYASESEPYQKDDGRWYKMVDGVEYQVVTGNEGGSLKDAISGAKSSGHLNEEDGKTVSQIGGHMSSALGNVTSFLIYVIFAFCFVTSATDILFISVPPLRPTLWKQTQSAGGMNNMQNHQVGMHGHQTVQTDIQKNWCLISDECKNTMNYQGYSQAQLLKIYIKKRAYALIVTVVVIWLLIVSSVFTDFGLNIGEMLLSLVVG